jgi:hypothetical protein
MPYGRNVTLSVTFGWTFSMVGAATIIEMVIACDVKVGFAYLLGR